MRRVQLYVDDATYREAREQLGDDFNWSAAFRDAIRAELNRRRDCNHDDLVCRQCGVVHPPKVPVEAPT